MAGHTHVHEGVAEVGRPQGREVLLPGVCPQAGVSQPLLGSGRLAVGWGRINCPNHGERRMGENIKKSKRQGTRMQTKKSSVVRKSLSDLPAGLPHSDRDDPSSDLTNKANLQDCASRWETGETFGANRAIVKCKPSLHCCLMSGQ